MVRDRATARCAQQPGRPSSSSGGAKQTDSNHRMQATPEPRRLVPFGQEERSPLETALPLVHPPGPTSSAALRPCPAAADVSTNSDAGKRLALGRRNTASTTVLATSPVLRTISQPPAAGPARWASSTTTTSCARHPPGPRHPDHGPRRHLRCPSCLFPASIGCASARAMFQQAAPHQTAFSAAEDVGRVVGPEPAQNRPASRRPHRIARHRAGRAGLNDAISTQLSPGRGAPPRPALSRVVLPMPASPSPRPPQRRPAPTAIASR